MSLVRKLFAESMRPPASRGKPSLPDGEPHAEAGEGRLPGLSPFGRSKLTPRNFDILEAMQSVAADVGATQAQVALARAVGRPGVASVLIGASRPEQVRDNAAALSVSLSTGQRERLDHASAPSLAYPSNLFTPMVKRFVFGGAEVDGWRPRSFRPLGIGRVPMARSRRAAVRRSRRETLPEWRQGTDRGRSAFRA